MKSVFLRKGAHAGVALFFVLLAPLATKNILIFFVLLLCIFFILVRVFRLCLKSIGSLKGTYGEFFLLLGVIASLFLSWPNVVLFQKAMIVLALADPLASLFGLYFGKHVYFVLDEKRTLEGSFVCFFIAFLIFVTFNTPVLVAVISAIVVSVVETLSLRGSDNIFIPISVVFMSKIFEGTTFFVVLNTIHI